MKLPPTQLLAEIEMKYIVLKSIHGVTLVFHGFYGRKLGDALTRHEVWRQLVEVLNTYFIAIFDHSGPPVAHQEHPRSVQLTTIVKTYHF